MIKRYFVLDSYQDTPFRSINVGVAIFALLMLGYVTKNYAITNFSSLGMMTLLYYQSLPWKQLLRRLFLIGFFLYLSFTLGVLAGNIVWIVPMTVGIIGFFCRFFLKLYKIPRPGGLFFALLSAMGTTIHQTPAQLLNTSLYFWLGILFSIGMAMLTKRLDQRPEQPVLSKSFQERYQDNPIIVLDSFFYGVALMLSIYISRGLDFKNPYWMTLACAAVLLADDLDSLKYRQVQYMIGAIGGLCVAALIFSASLNALLLSLVIAVLYGFSQFFMTRNYTIANFFVNPTILLLVSFSQHNSYTSLIEARFLGIFLGGGLGLGLYWILSIGIDHLVNTVSEHSENLENWAEEREGES